MQKSIIFGVILIICLIGGIVYPSIAFDTPDVSRSDFRSLELRVRTLETKIRRLQGSSSFSRSPSVLPPTQPQIIEGELVGKSDPLMERFANLLIDLKEQVKGLEQRINQLENKKKL